MIVIKYGGSILNPDGKYNEDAIHKLEHILQDNENEDFCLIVGGGKVCRYLQDAAQPFLEDAGVPEAQMGYARDEIGIATTKINARYLQGRLVETFGDDVCPDLVIDPHSKPQEGFRIYLATGAVPGSSTDYDTIELAKVFKAQKAIKISDFPVVLDVKALEFDKNKLDSYEALPEMTWPQMLDLVGEEWVAGGNYPLDPKAAVLGTEMSKDYGFELMIGQYSQLENMIAGKEYVGTRVKN